jgi:hypothetical protein
MAKKNSPKKQRNSTLIPSSFHDFKLLKKGLDNKESLEIARKAGIKNVDINAAYFDVVKKWIE